MANVKTIGAGPEQEAAAWYARLSGAGAGAEGREQDAFNAWLAADRANERAYEKVATTLASLSALSTHPDITALRAGAADSMRARRRNRVWVGFPWAAGLAAIVLVGLVGVWQLSVERMTVQTAPGELRHATLSDGTRAWLGSDSRVAVAYSSEQRAITVERGEVFFDVSQNKQRPFVVLGRDHTVTALGTAFDVRVFDSTLIVTLLRGSVSVREASVADGTETRLKPGQQYSLNSQGATVRDVDAQAQVSWHQGLIELDATPLDEAVAIFNHNSGIKLRIGDERLSALRVSGTFHTGRAWDFASALEFELPVVAEKQAAGDILLKHR